MSHRKDYDAPVPLFLIGAAIIRGVRLRRGTIHRISVVRMQSHHYLIKYTCRALDTGSIRTINPPKINGIDPQQVAGIDRWNEDHD